MWRTIMIKKYFTFVALSTSILFLSGCAEKNNRICGGGSSTCGANTYQKSPLSDSGHKAYQFKIKPIVGSRQDDAKVVVNMGKVLKIWVAPYKVKGTMIASHDIYSWVVKPDFIVGESIPNPRNRDGVITPLNNVPFAFKPKEIENAVLPLKDEQVKDYVNDVYNNKRKACY